MWHIHRHLKTGEPPPRRLVVYIEFADVKKLKSWWLVEENGEIDLCMKIRAMRSMSVYTLTCSASRKSILVACRWFARSRFVDDNPFPSFKS